jgi:Galactose oxidase, central domain
MNDNNNPLNTAQLYNPLTQSLSPTGNLTMARYGHSATLLINGMVLIAGGYDINGNSTDTTELYDPLKGTFTGGRQHASGAVPSYYSAAEE